MTGISRIKDIHFRHLQPHNDAGTQVSLCNIEGARNTVFEFVNTIIPNYDMKGIASILDIPRMSTLAIAALIDICVRQMPNDSAYVNVGVWNGFTLFAGMVNNPNKKCIGVDNFSEFGGPRGPFAERFGELKSEKHEFFDMDYTDYFRRFHKGKIGVYFYDGGHDYENQLRGLQLAEPFLSEDGIVIVDDTNWDDPRRATMDFIEHSGHEYEFLLDETTAGNGHPTWWNGIMALRRVD